MAHIRQMYLAKEFSNIYNSVKDANVMRGKILIVGVVCVMVALSFAGCLDGGNNGGGQALDSDGDGYPDSEDDFPDDVNLHEKEIIYDSWESHHGWWEVSPDDPWQYSWEVNSDDEYVFILATGDIASYQDQNIFLENPSMNKEYESGCINNERFTVTSENWGTWRIYFYNKTPSELEVGIKVHIYR